MSRYTVKNSWFRGGIVIIDRKKGIWRLVDRATRTVLDYGFVTKSGWSFYMNAGRN